MFSFSKQSRTLIENILINARNSPMYAGYTIEKDFAFDPLSNENISIRITKGEMLVNMFLFFPAYNDSGKIGSVAIYGSQLDGHKRAIERTMKLFGLPVESIDWDHGVSTYLDVTLEDYNL